MADTLSLDKVIEFVISRGGSVRLIGDDQQLWHAVGAGGVLRDIQATHGSLHLTELMRFADPSRRCRLPRPREGLPEALGFYLDRDRVHVGDLATMTDDVFTAWQPGHAAGRDAIMLAPTRDLVAELNQRARLHRLTADDTGRPHQPSPSPTATSLGRRHRHHPHQRPSPAHRRHGLGQERGPLDRSRRRQRRDCERPTRQERPPRDTARRPTSLPPSNSGTPRTIHTAQGVTADTSHTLLSGSEPRQLAYTALTRGRHANHLYLEVVGDGDEHNVIRPDHTHPLTATDILEQILARDDSSRSATTTARDAKTPALQLVTRSPATSTPSTLPPRQRLGPAQVATPRPQPTRSFADLTRADAWPTLRAHLMLLVSARPRPGPSNCTRQPRCARSTPLPTSPPSWTGASTTPACAAPAPAPALAARRPRGPRRRPRVGPLPGRAGRPGP
jgi:hypothetical protein